MKRTILLLTLVIFGLTNVNAQASFSCVKRSYCYWNASTEKYGDCSGYDENSLFVMNKDETMFTHTTETIKSTYYVDSKEYDEKNDVYTYNVTSDVGNKYFYIFDVKNKEIRAVFKKDAKTVLLTFTVKSMF